MANNSVRKLVERRLAERLGELTETEALLAMDPEKNRTSAVPGNGQGTNR
jgi:hypothetical protein